MSAGKIFLDTNIIVYAYDVSAGQKHSVAQQILIDLWDSGLGVISTQVLQELFVSITRKIPRPLKANVARRILNDFLKWDVILVDGGMILDAVDLHDKHRVSFWDAVIVCAAVRGGARQLLSEDLQSGLAFSGLSIINPFAEPR